MGHVFDEKAERGLGRICHGGKLDLSLIHHQKKIGFGEYCFGRFIPLSEKEETEKVATSKSLNSQYVILT